MAKLDTIVKPERSNNNIQLMQRKIRKSINRKEPDVKANQCGQFKAREKVAIMKIRGRVKRKRQRKPKLLIYKANTLFLPFLPTLMPHHHLYIHHITYTHTPHECLYK